MHVKDYLFPFQQAAFSGIDRYDYTLMHTPRHTHILNVVHVHNPISWYECIIMGAFF